MIATFKPCKLHGKIDAPPSKSMAHRYLLGAALSGQKCTLSGVDYSEDVLASIDCLTALGAKLIPSDLCRRKPQSSIAEKAEARYDFLSHWRLQWAKK